MKRITTALVLIGIVYFASNYFGIARLWIPHFGKDNAHTTRASDHPSSGSQLSGTGKVLRILSDDNAGSRHQRFIIELTDGRTLLVAHNIDIAPRVPSLTIGDTIAFKGVYERNSKGGVVHWTHQDPKGHHEAGWLRKGGRTYQ